MNGTLNKVMLIGRLGSDVKLTYFDKDSCTGQVSFATDESYTDKTTQAKVENTQWHNVVFYNKMAERVEKYAKKGDLLYVEGRLRTRQYQGQDGVTRYVTEVVALDINFLSPRRTNHSYYNYSHGSSGRAYCSSRGSSYRDRRRSLLKIRGQGKSLLYN